MTVGFNGANAVINGANLALAGGFNVTLNTTGTTNVTLPTSGTLGIGGAWVLIQTLPASNSATISFTGLATYVNYMVLYDSLIPANNNDYLIMVASTNNGASYLNSNYQSGTWYSTYNVSGFTNYLTNTVNFLITPNIKNAAPGASGAIYLYNLNNSSSICLHGEGFLYNTAANLTTCVGYNSGTTAINAIQFAMSTGNITSGSFSLYAIAT